MTKKPDADREPGDLQALRGRLWDAVEAAHALLRSRTNDTRIRAIHALSQSAAAYRAVLEAGDFETRIRKLEAVQEDKDE